MCVRQREKENERDASELSQIGSLAVTKEDCGGRGGKVMPKWGATGKDSKSGGVCVCVVDDTQRGNSGEEKRGGEEASYAGPPGVTPTASSFQGRKN